MPRHKSLQLTNRQRRLLWQVLNSSLEEYYEKVPQARVTPILDPAGLREKLQAIDFKKPVPLQKGINFCLQGLWHHQVHTPHPRYFGLFNPAPTTMGIAADTLVAAFNPQLAAWSHSPFAVEVENHLIRTFAAAFGLPDKEADGTFCSGGSEANHTALLTALAHVFPGFLTSGLRSLKQGPVFYASNQSHHSLLNAARCCGLGSEALRLIPIDDGLRLDIKKLSAQINKDRKEGFRPFMIVATAGSTGAGIIDPLAEIAEIAAQEHLWLHVDAAWGGAAIFIPELRPLLNGIERADSITFDAHKWLSVPMGAGMYFTRHPEILCRTFALEANYMPHEADGLAVVDPYRHSMQWSRRFIGLKLFLSLLIHGWQGYAANIRHQVEMGEHLRGLLIEEGWHIVNQTPLPVVCFIDPKVKENERTSKLQAIVAHVTQSGKAWISSVRLDKGMALRACITNYRTGKSDLKTLIRALAAARREVAS